MRRRRRCARSSSASSRRSTSRRRSRSRSPSARSQASIDGEDVGRLIGRRGQTIDAVQFICYRAAQRGATDRKRVIVDAGGYRERRREQLEDQAERAAARATEAGKEIELEPMTPSERKVVHDYLAERPGIETFSEGDEPDRCVIVAPLVESTDDDD